MYPEYDPYDGSEELSWENMWTGDNEQIINGVDCMTPFASLNPTENLIVLKLTETEWTEMLSALYIGAEFTYPAKYLQIVANFLKGIHCPPVMVEQECYEYPTYASFLQYSPMNPYLTPDEIPDGYASTPFLVNGENGVNIPNYEHFDILVPTDALTLDVNWFEDISGQLPSITLMVEGAGKVFLKMLTYVGGGLAVITVDNPPDLLDILAGIVTSSDNILDLNQDIISLPPETAQEVIYELDIVGTGLHTIYVVFLPILDDSLIPVRFGGGFRGVQLCNFVEQPIMGVQEIRFNDATCNLENLIDGEWSVVTGWENWLDCVPSGGGGGGVSSLVVNTYGVDFANQDTTSATPVKAVGTAIFHTFTKANALVLAEMMTFNNGANNTYVELRVSTGTATPANPSRRQLNANSTVVASANIVGIDLGSQEVAVYLSAQAGTARIIGTARCVYTIIEYDDASSLFVEDIRILDGELQKKIGGAWIPVTESLNALLDTIAAAAAAAQTAADSAIATNTAQQAQINSIITVNNNQNTRLTNLETFQTDAELSFLGIQAQLDNHESRLDTIEASFPSLSEQEFWAKEWNFLASPLTWSVDAGSWVSGQGFVVNGTTFNMRILGTDVPDNRITHMKLYVRKMTGGFGTASIEWAGTESFAVIRMSGSQNLNTCWVKVQNQQNQPNLASFLMSNFSGEIRIEAIKLLGRGTSFLP